MERDVYKLEDAIITKTIHRLLTMLNLDTKLEMIGQQISYVNNSIEPKIIEKVTELFADNLDEIIPSLDPIRKRLEVVAQDANNAENATHRISGIANAAKAGIDELKQEFEYMKTRFSPQFVQRVDKALSAIQTIQYDVEVIKMTTAHAAMKKDLDLVEQKLHSYVKIITFEGLVDEVRTMTPLVELEKTNVKLDANIKSQQKFAIAKDVYDKFSDVQIKLNNEINLKVNIVDW